MHLDTFFGALCRMGTEGVKIKQAHSDGQSEKNNDDVNNHIELCINNNCREWFYLGFNLFSQSVIQICLNKHSCLYCNCKNIIQYVHVGASMSVAV